MKKVTVVLLSMLLVLAMGQAVFAKGSVGLTAGYSGTVSGGSGFASGLNVGISGDYYLINRLSLAGGASLGVAFIKNSTTSTTALSLNANLFVKYDIVQISILSGLLKLGAQAGVIYDRVLTGPFAFQRNALFLALGVYADAYVTSKINIYADLKFPLGLFDFVAGDSHGAFFEKFFYNVKIGATYAVSPKINVGIECGISNTNIISALMKSDSIYKFSVGAKVGYIF